MTAIPITNEIVSFMHCGSCTPLKPDNVTPRDWSMTEAGWTELGFQVWCKRCESNVIHINFEGVKHPGDQSRVPYTASEGIAHLAHLLQMIKADTQMQELAVLRSIELLNFFANQVDVIHEQQDQLNFIANELLAYMPSGPVDS